MPAIKKLSEVKNPSPTEAISFVDESVETVDDGYFAVNATRLSDWQNSPTARHVKSGVFGFVDGHAESWRWLALSRDQKLSVSYMQYGANTLTDLKGVQRAVFRP